MKFNLNIQHQSFFKQYCMVFFVLCVNFVCYKVDQIQSTSALASRLRKLRESIHVLSRPCHVLSSPNTPNMTTFTNNYLYFKTCDKYLSVHQADKFVLKNTTDLVAADWYEIAYNFYYSLFAWCQMPSIYICRYYRCCNLRTLPWWNVLPRKIDRRVYSQPAKKCRNFRNNIFVAIKKSDNQGGMQLRFVCKTFLFRCIFEFFKSCYRTGNCLYVLKYLATQFHFIKN